jgi:hypothetical protein
MDTISISKRKLIKRRQESARRVRLVKRLAEIRSGVASLPDDILAIFAAAAGTFRHGGPPLSGEALKLGEERRLVYMSSGRLRADVYRHFHDAKP